jgi:hypothetical protein
MGKKHKPDIKREDCHTEKQKFEYSKQQYYRSQSIIGQRPSAMLDLEKFPLERAPWHSGEYHLMVEQAQRAQARLQRKLRREKHDE